MSERPAETARRRAAVLVVDDERGIRDLLTLELGIEGYRVTTACDGQEALELIRRERFQVIISDINMPRVGGLELLRAVKGLDPDVEVIISTGYGTVEAAVKAMKEGAYDFIQKPFHIEEMLALVEKALEKNEVAALLAVYESSRAVFASLELEELLPVVTRLSARVLRADDAAVLLAGADGMLAPALADGAADPQRASRRLALAGKSGPAGGGPFIVDQSGDAEWSSAIVCPLELEGERLGALVACRRSGAAPFVPADVRSATIFASLLALSLRNAGLYRRLEQKIAEIELMQQRVVQSEKLAAVGQLAAGVAHEINNPLTSILGFAELLAPSLREEQKEDIECVIREARRCRTIAQGLLQLGRRREPCKEPVSLRALIELMLGLTRGDKRSADVEIELALPGDLPPIFADPAQLQQVFLNLITNACHALEGRAGGRLRIAAVHRGERVIVRFEDNGSGIKPEHVNRIFEPFFTTKPDGHGTGLGLSISHGLIEQNGGSIEVKSNVGIGTVFSVDLPACARPTAAESGL